MFTFDERDREIVAARIAARDSIEGPRVGDFLEIGDELRRVAHCWDDERPAIQPTWRGLGGAPYLDTSGHASYSGGLDPAIPVGEFSLVGQREGTFWIFHHDSWGARRGVEFEAPCRVFRHG